MTNENLTQTAQIIASYGRNYIVRTSTQHRYRATTRSKRTHFACGDFVHIHILDTQQAVIETLIPRKSLLYRQDIGKSKFIAANVTQLFIILAPSPSPSEALLQRALVAAEAAQISTAIILNKADLPQTTIWHENLSFYTQLGYPLICLSAHENIDVLRPILHGHTNIFLGQSGVGKSTLTNALLGVEVARTNVISTALNSGKHTTTHACLYDLDSHTQLIDSPGLQEFGLHHLHATELLNYFPDLRHLSGQCRFHNCTHRSEPNCALKQAADAGTIKSERLAFLQKISNELLHF